MGGEGDTGSLETGVPPPPGPFGGHTDRVRGARVWDAPDGAGLLTLPVHTGRVWGVAVSPDGTRIVTAGEDGTARVWDAANGAGLLTLTGHTDPVWGVAVSPDGTRIVTAGEDETARVWDAANGAGLLTLTGHTGRVWGVAVSPDGTRIVTAGEDETARVWDAANGAGLLTLTGHTDPVWGVAVSPDGTRIVTAGEDETARVWDAANGAGLLTLTGHTGPVWGVAVSPDGTRIVTAGADETARVWDAANGAGLLTLTGHTGPVWGVAVSPDGHELVSVGGDGTIRVWNLHSGVQVRGTTLPAVVSADVLADPISDEPSGSDLLDIGGEVRKVAGLVAASSTRPPLSIALLADWGGGKSSFMLQMQQHVDQLAALSRNNRGRTVYASNVRQVRFNAWHYSDSHVWCGIVEQLFRELVDDPSAAAPDPERARRRRAQLEREIARVSREQAEVATRLGHAARSGRAGGVFSWLASPRQVALLGWALLREAARDLRASWRLLAAWVVLATLGVLVWSRFETRLTSILATVAVAAGPLAVVLRRVRAVNATVAAFAERGQARLRRRDGDLTAELGKLREELGAVDAVVALDGFLDHQSTAADWERYRGLIGEVHGHLRRLSQLLQAASAHWIADPQGDPPIERVVLYIDDLDRCPPARVVEVLAAVHMLLALPLFVVVVGVDARWLRRSLEHHDHTLFGQEGTLGARFAAQWASDPMDYLDKIFQIPFALRAMNDTAAARYIRSLLPTGMPAAAAAAASAPAPPGATPAATAGQASAARASAAAGHTHEFDAYDEGRDLWPTRTGPALSPVPDLRPASLALQSHEVEFLAHLGVLLPTPRAAKKLVNLYRLVRIGVPDAELALFAGAPDSIPYRAAGLLLGILVGTATLADSVLTAILRAGGDDKLAEVLATLAQQQDPHLDLDSGPWRRLTSGASPRPDEPCQPQGVPRTGI